MAPNVEQNFDTLRFNLLNLKTVSLDENVNPDKSYSGDYLNNLKTEYFCQDEIISHLKTKDKNNFSMMHHDIRSINKN